VNIPFPPSRGSHGLSNELWTTEWFRGQNRNSTQDPIGAISSAGVNASAPCALDTRTIVTAPEVAVAGAEDVLDAADEYCALVRLVSERRVLRRTNDVVGKCMVWEGFCWGSLIGKKRRRRRRQRRMNGFGGGGLSVCLKNPNSSREKQLYI